MKEFDSLGAFARHLARLAAVGEEVTSHLANESAKIVQANAKSRMGEYQDGVGGFPAWANLADATVQDRLRQGFTPDDPLVRSGELRESIEIEHRGGEATVGSANSVLLYQELGTEPGSWGAASTSGIPPRPVLGPAGFTSREKIGQAVGLGLMAWIAGLSWKRPPRLEHSESAGPAPR